MRSLTLSAFPILLAFIRAVNPGPKEPIVLFGLLGCRGDQPTFDPVSTWFVIFTLSGPRHCSINILRHVLSRKQAALWIAEGAKLTGDAGFTLSSSSISTAQGTKARSVVGNTAVGSIPAASPTAACTYSDVKGLSERGGRISQSLVGRGHGAASNQRTCNCCSIPT